MSMVENRQLIVEASELGALLKSHDFRLSTVESCTGGGIGYTVTSLAGSSDWFDRAYVTYSNEAKSEMVGVSPKLIDEHGAVSEEVALAMVDGGLRESGSDCCVAVTGVAGPGGGSAAKPVGMVCFGWGFRVSPGKSTFNIETHYFDGDRQDVRKSTIYIALQGMAKLVTEAKS